MNGEFRMSDDLGKYIKEIQLRNALTGRPWYWEKNAHRSKPVAYALEYNPFTLALKTRRYISRRRMLAPLMASNRPTGILRKQADFRLFRDNRHSNSFEIQFSSAPSPSAFTLIDRAPKLPSGYRKLIILHAFYEDEANAIMDKLDQFTDYDLMLTTPIPAIRDRFLARFDPRRSACFLAANVGRDVLPFLLVLAFGDLSGYPHFVKIHTKRSSHLSHGGKWFSANVEVLVGDHRMTDRIFDLIDPKQPSIYGLECRPMTDHFRSNRHWLKYLLQTPDRNLKAHFIPGTMFAGSAEFLRQLAALNLHLHQFEEEKGQLDGCLIHALERYFGHFAQTHGGECATFDSLISKTSA
jgi:lipopolysaccharide biosynthesis protein